MADELNASVGVRRRTRRSLRAGLATRRVLCRILMGATFVVQVARPPG